MPPPLPRRLKKYAFFLSFLFLVAFGPPHHCVVICDPFLVDGMFNVLVRRPLTIFLRLCFIVRVPPSLPHFELEALSLALPCTLLYSSHSPYKLNSPIHTMFNIVKHPNSNLTCIVVTPSPRALNIYTLLKAGNQRLFTPPSSSSFGDRRQQPVNR